jgi:hypothetical protein
MISPVIQPLSAEARNTATGAISLGRPIRPNGVCAIAFFSKSLPEKSAALTGTDDDHIILCGL